MAPFSRLLMEEMPKQLARPVGDVMVVVECEAVGDAAAVESDAASALGKSAECRIRVPNGDQ